MLTKENLTKRLKQQSSLSLASTPDSPSTKTQKITSLQSLISHHYLTTLQSPSNFQPFMRTSTRRNTQSKCNSANITKKGFSSSLSFDNGFSAKSLSDFRFTNNSSQQLNKNNSTNYNIDDLRNANTSKDLPKYILEEKNASVSCKDIIHNKIIEIGETICEKIQISSQENYEKDLKLKEFELRRLYTNEMVGQVEKERSKFHTKLESIKAQMKCDFEKVLKEKANEIESYAQNISKEQIEANKLESRKHLTETIENLQNKLTQEREDAVTQAVKTQTETMEAKLDEQKKFYENKIEDLNEKWLNKLHQNQSELRLRLTKETERQFLLNNQQMKFEKNKEIEDVREKYETELDSLKSDYQSKKSDLSQMRARIDLLNYENDQLKSIVQELKEELKNCIERFSMRAKNEKIQPKSILKNYQKVKSISFKE